MGKKIVVIGGVAAGATAAAKARRTDETAEITIIEKNGYISFANCGMPYYIGNIIKKRDALVFHNEESFKKRFNITVHTHTEATHIDTLTKTVYAVKNGNNVTFSYDKLILCNGARAVTPPVEGISSIPYFTLRSIEDMDLIKAFIEKNSPSAAAIIGAGYIGVEIAEALYHCGLKVTVVEALPFILPTFSPEISLNIYETMVQSGITVKCNSKVIKASQTDSSITLTLDNLEEIKTDLVIIATGVRPDTSLAKSAGIKIGALGGIEVNDKMETSAKDIYAAGDVTEKTNLITGKKMLAPLAGPANREGRVAGCNAAGGNLSYKGTLPTAIVSFQNACCAQTGLSFGNAVKEGFDAAFVYVEEPDHVEYYPGATYIFLKLIYDKKTGRILGAEASGEKGVERRIDIIATAIYGKLTIYDLENIDLCYSPPYGAAKDPVNIAGYVASNIHRKESLGITPQDFLAIMANKEVQIVDVRTKAEYRIKRIKSSVNIPVNELRDQIGQLNRNTPVYVYCAVGYRGYLASKILNHMGYSAYNIVGGIEAVKRIAKINNMEVIDGNNS